MRKQFSRKEIQAVIDRLDLLATEAGESANMYTGTDEESAYERASRYGEARGLHEAWAQLSALRDGKWK